MQLRPSWGAARCAPIQKLQHFMEHKLSYPCWRGPLGCLSPEPRHPVYITPSSLSPPEQFKYYPSTYVLTLLVISSLLPSPQNPLLTIQSRCSAHLIILFFNTIMLPPQELHVHSEMVRVTNRRRCRNMSSYSQQFRAPKIIMKRFSKKQTGETVLVRDPTAQDGRSHSQKGNWNVSIYLILPAAPQHSGLLSL
jgi:hypothetical protein